MGILKFKRFPIFSVFGAFVLFSSSLHASPAVLPGAVSPADFSSASQVGIVAALRGAVQIASRGQVGKLADSGQPVFLGDAVSTDEKGSLQILLLDQTVFTIGPNSSIVIDKFVYDPATDDGVVKAKVVKGIFRFVTGKIGQKKPQQMEVDLPSGNIGIRGTIVAGEVTGKKSLVVLLGPGEKNNTGHREGKFILSNESGGKLHQETVGKTGFGSTIEGDGVAPSRPFQLPAEQMARLTTALGPLPIANSQSQGTQAGGQDAEGESEASGESPTEQSGQGTAVAGETVGLVNAISALMQILSGQSNKASQDSASETTTIQDGIAKFSDFTRVQSGIFHYIVSAVAHSGGTHSIKFDIDFGARRVGGGNSHFDVTGAGAGAASITTMPFGAGPENATYNYSFTNFCGAGCTATLKLDLVNQNNVPAANSQYIFTSNNGSVSASGTAPRVDGAAP